MSVGGNIVKERARKNVSNFILAQRDEAKKLLQILIIDPC